MRLLVALVVIASMGCATTPLGQAVQGTAGGAVVLGAGIGTGISAAATGASLIVVASLTDSDIPVSAAAGVAGGVVVSAVLLGIGGSMLSSSADSLDDYARRAAEADRVQFEKLARPAPTAKRAPKAPAPAPEAAAEDTEARSVAGVNE
jgi:hypothetical protein